FERRCAHDCVIDSAATGKYFPKNLLHIWHLCLFLLLTFYVIPTMARLNLLEETRFEKVPVSVHADPTAASLAVAKRIADLIRSKKERGEQAILGLATGATPVRVYAELVRLHREEGLSFQNV